MSYSLPAWTVPPCDGVGNPLDSSRSTLGRGYIEPCLVVHHRNTPHVGARQLPVRTPNRALVTRHQLATRVHIVITLKGRFTAGPATTHLLHSLLISPMESGNLRANYLSATRKVSHIQNSGHGPIVSSSSADILTVLIHIIFEHARPGGHPRPPRPDILKRLIGRARLANPCT